MNKRTRLTTYSVLLTRIDATDAQSIGKTIEAYHVEAHNTLAAIAAAHSLALDLWLPLYPSAEERRQMSVYVASETGSTVCGTFNLSQV